MSFGFSVGDLITVMQLANKIRKEFIDVPSQFKAISDEVRSLSIVLLDVEVVLSDRELRNEQESELKQIADSCRNVLSQLEHTLDEYDELKSGHGSVSAVKRVWKRLKWEPEDVKQLRSRISTNVGLLNAFTSGLTRDNVIMLVQRQEDQGRQIILDWITPSDYALQQSDFISRRQEGTGQWLLSSVEFHRWLATDKQTLFCPGIPGAGKTILTSIVVEELLARFENNGNISVAYLYCNYQRQHEQNPVDLFASVLKQLTQKQPSIPDGVATLYDRHKDKRTRPSLDEILGTLQIVVKTYSRVFVIIDALDECKISGGCRQRFLSGLFNLQAKCGVNLFATSRPILLIGKAFEGTSILEIRASKDDVQKYLDGQLFQLPGFVARNHKLQEDIKAGISNAVDGMFLLAQLYLESLTGKTTPKAIQTTLKHLVTGSGAYDHAYEDAMRRINGQIKDQEVLAKRVLSWITCAKRQLTTTELQYALGVEVGESELDEENLPQIEDMVSVCAGLVTVDEQSRIIRLVHYTTKEYFERTQGRWFPEAETEITITCVTYLSFNEFKSGICRDDTKFMQRLQSNKLYDYATHNWGHHARKASVPIAEVITFLERKSCVEASSQVLLAAKSYLQDTRYSQRFPKDITGMHLAAYFGIKAVVQLILEEGADIAAVDSNGWTPLHWASENRHLEVVQLLLEKGANTKAVNNNGWTLLHWASWKGHLEVVQLLLEKGAKINTVDKDGSTSLRKASQNGHLEVIRLLLKKGAIIDISTKDKSTPLHEASRNGYLEIVRLLLEKKADINSATNYGSTPIHHASWNGHLEVIQLLLEKGAEINTAEKDGSTSLRMASQNGHLEVVRLLLGKEADVNTSTIYGSTPLQEASRYGYFEVVQLLLEKGANTKAVNDNKWTPLHSASWNGHLKVVQLLLEKGAKINTVNKDGSTPLHEASQNGHLEVVRLLLEKEANVNTTTIYGSTPLYNASRNGHLEVIRLLLEKKANINTATRYGSTPLRQASENKHIEVVKFLLEKGANITVKDT